MQDGAKPRDLEDRTYRFAESVRAFVKQLPSRAGEHRLPACPFRQLAEKFLERLKPLCCATLLCRRQAADDCRLASLPRLELSEKQN